MVLTHGVGVVVLSGSLAAAVGSSVGLVHRVGRGVRVLRLLCNLVGDVLTELADEAGLSSGSTHTATSVLFLVVNRHFKKGTSYKYLLASKGCVCLMSEEVRL